MSYLQYDSESYKLTGFVPLSGVWYVLLTDDYEFWYTVPVATLANVEEKSNGRTMLIPIISDGDIGGEWQFPNDDFYLGIVGPGEDQPNENEMKTRMRITKEIAEERREELRGIIPTYAILPKAR